MAERVPPPADETHILAPNNNNSNNDNNDDDTDSQFPRTEPNPKCFCRPAGATYVVQVPKDQIYRVPPPENAALAERLRQEKPAKSHAKGRGKCRPCASRCCCCLLLLTALLLAMALAATLLSLYFDPVDPVFNVERLDVISVDSRKTNLTRDYTYKLALRSDNPNAKVDVSYERGGAVSLWFRQEEIAAGKFPAFYNVHGSSTEFETVLRGSDVKNNHDRRLPKEIEKNMKSNNGTKARVALTLKMSNLSAKTEVWTWKTRSIKLDVACDMTVDSLMSKDSARVLSQQCRTTS